MKKIILTLSLILAGTAVCATVEHPMDAMFKTWINTPVKEVVKAWGNPTEIDYKRGQTEYKWAESSARFIPGTQFQQKVECERKLIVNVSGEVVYGTFNGTGCPFTTEGVKKWNNPKEKY